MQVISWDEFINTPPSPLKPIIYSAMTIGVFDGVHRGHQALIERIVKRGHNPTVVTFRQNPKMVLSPATFSGDIIALDEKLNIFEKMGVTRTILIDFSEKFSKMKGSVFIEYLIKRGLVFLAVGSNFRCGHCLSTDAREIRRMTGERGIETEIVPSVLFEGEPISSSRIRTAIAAGDFEKVKAALGRN